MKTAVGFKWRQHRKGYMSLGDFMMQIFNEIIIISHAQMVYFSSEAFYLIIVEEFSLIMYYSILEQLKNMAFR